MSDPIVGSVQMFGFGFMPRQWAYCDGRLMSVTQNQSLYAVLGTLYGGDGKTSFALPNLSGRVPIHDGQGPGLTPISPAQNGGAASVTLTQNELPFHNHALFGEDQVPEDPVPNTDSLPGALVINATAESAYTDQLSAVPMAGQAIGSTGGGQAHENRQPFIAVNFCIAVFGLVLSRG